MGFQTHLKWGAQKEVLQLIPGLEQAEIVRYGVMHRNTFINSPKVLRATYQFNSRDDLFFAGQMTGVEGYVESAASGLVAGVNAARIFNEMKPVQFPIETAIGSMANYITTTNSKNFQPMNANFGLFPELPEKIRKKQERNEQHAKRAIETIQNFMNSL